jgi:chromosomal replication initiator protein
MSVLSSFWNEFLEKLEKEQGRIPVLYSILKHVKPLELTDEKIVVSCENQGAKIFLEQRKAEVEREVYGYVQKNLAVEFVLAPPKKKKVESPLLSFEPTPEDLYSKSGLNQKYTFDNFAVSSTNQVAYAAAQAVVNNPGSAYNPLFFYGGVGVGKTHLAQAVAKKILENDKNKKIYFCPGDKLTNEMI